MFNIETLIFDNAFKKSPNKDKENKDHKDNKNSYKKLNKELKDMDLSDV